MDKQVRESIEQRKEDIRERGHALDLVYSDEADVGLGDAALYELDKLLELDDRDRL